MKNQTASLRQGAPLRAADIRSDPVREPIRETPERRQRLRKGIANVSPTHIPREMIPDGVDLQWVTDTIHGLPELQGRQSFEINGWEAVTPDMFSGRFDGMFMPKGYKGEINVLGSVLMWRDMELTMEARAEEREQAVSARVAIEQKLRNGELDGVSFDTQHPTARKVTSVVRDSVSAPIPD